MEYTLKRSSRSRAIRISLTHDGEVVVSAPRLALKLFIDQFVKQNETWINRQRQRMHLTKLANPTLDFTQGIVSFMGKLYRIQFVETAADKVRFDQGVCFVAPITHQEKDVKVTLFKWLKMMAEKELATRTKVWADRMGVRYGTVRFGQQVSRWGSCTGQGNLRFNWRLIHFAPEIIDYVVIHELAHIVHHDHSDRFWTLVGTYCVDYKARRKFLKRQMIETEKM